MVEGVSVGLEEFGVSLKGLGVGVKFSPSHEGLIKGGHGWLIEHGASVGIGFGEPDFEQILGVVLRHGEDICRAIGGFERPGHPGGGKAQLIPLGRPAPWAGTRPSRRGGAPGKRGHSVRTGRNFPEGRGPRDRR